MIPTGAPASPMAWIFFSKDKINDYEHTYGVSVDLDKFCRYTSFDDNTALFQIP